MNNPSKKLGAVGAILACMTFSIIPEIASATTVTCGERGSSYRSISKSDGVYTLNVKTQDYVLWHELHIDTDVQVSFGKGFSKVASTGSFSVPKGINSVKLKVSGKDAKLGVSCGIGLGAVEETHQALGLSANSQIMATNTGLGINAASRFGNSGNFISKNQVYVSTQNLPANKGFGRLMPADWSAWATLDSRSYSGGIAGISVDFVGGVDALVNPDLLVGVLAGYGRTMISDGGTAQVVSAPMIGAYASKKTGTSLITNGFLSFSRPRNDISGASFLSSRIAVGVNMSGSLQKQKVLLEPFIFARAYNEQLPTYTTGGAVVIPASETSAFAASIGVRVNFTGAENTRKLVPYASLAADYRRTLSTTGPGDAVLAPRIGFGLKGSLGKGKVSVDFDIGKTRSDTIDRGIKFGYELSF